MANSLSSERTSRSRNRSPTPFLAPQIEITPVWEEQPPSLQLDTLKTPWRTTSTDRQSIDTDVSEIQETDEFRAAVVMLEEKFEQQFGTDSTPKQVFQTIINLKRIPPAEAYTCLALVYPSLFRTAFAIQTICAKVWQILGNARPGYLEHLTTEPFKALNEPHSWWTWEVWGFSQRDMPYLLKCQKLNEAKTLLESLLPLLSELQLKATKVEEKTKLLDWHQHHSSLNKDFIANKFVVLEGWDREATLAYEATLSRSSSEEPTPGIDRMDSGSTALALPIHTAHLRDRSRNRSSQSLPDKPTLSKKKKSRARPDPKLLISYIKSLRQKITLKNLARRESAKWLVAIMSLIAAAAIGLAVWRCPPGPPSTRVALDSNFWSTISSTIVNIVTFYALVIPMMRRENIQARNPWLFKISLFLNASTSLVAFGVYPASPRASLIVGFVSNIASILATLELIQEAASTIQEATTTIRKNLDEIRFQKNEIEDLNIEVDMLRHERM